MVLVLARSLAPTAPLFAHFYSGAMRQAMPNDHPWNGQQYEISVFASLPYPKDFEVREYGLQSCHSGPSVAWYQDALNAPALANQ